MCRTTFFADKMRWYDHVNACFIIRGQVITKFENNVLTLCK
jgi:hypothetical protein